MKNCTGHEQLSSPHVEHPAPYFVELDIRAEKEDTICSHNAGKVSIQHPEFLIQFHGCQIAVNQDLQEEDLMKVFRVVGRV